MAISMRSSKPIYAQMWDSKKKPFEFLLDIPSLDPYNPPACLRAGIFMNNPLG
ncbi:MAG: hypothetical protein Fur0022_16900 [Anaerolineales bacterium]